MKGGVVVEQKSMIYPVDLNEALSGNVREHHPAAATAALKSVLIKVESHDSGEMKPFMDICAELRERYIEAL